MDNIKLNRHVLGFILVVVLWLAATGCGGQDGPQGRIVYQAVGADGKPVAELVVADAHGKELRRVAVPGEVVGLYPLQYPLSGHALYEDPFNKRWFLVEVTSGALQTFDAFGQAREYARPCGYTAHWVALCGSKSAYVLDVDSGHVTEVSLELALAAPTPLMLVPALTPDESHFVLQTFQGLYLVPAATPEKARRLGGETFALDAELSADSQYVLYLQPDEGRDREVVREKLDGSGSEVLLTGPAIQRVAFVPKSEQLLVSRYDSVLLISPQDGVERELFTAEEPICQMRVDPTGKKGAFSTCGFSEETVAWLYVDLEKTVVTPLDELKDFRRVYTRPGSRWVFLGGAASESGEEQFASLDLETGKVHPQLSFKSGYPFYPTGFEDDGRVALATTVSPEGRMQIWLLQADQADARLLAEASVASAGLAPGGRWVVLAVGERSGDQLETTIKIVATGDGKEQVVGPGLMPVWVGP